METEKIADERFIKVTIADDNLEVSIKYPKRSTLETRFKLIDKLKEVLRKI
jgi:hypothetical protein